MNERQPILRDQRKIDADHLQLLAVFHFVLAGMSVLGILFLFLHYRIMDSVFSNPAMWEEQGESRMNPEQFFNIFRWIYFVVGVVVVSSAVGNLLSGFFIRARKNRLFSLIVAGFDCLLVPVGTLLGVFTYIVLLRDSVQGAYSIEQQNGVSGNA